MVRFPIERILGLQALLDSKLNNQQLSSNLSIDSDEVEIPTADAVRDYVLAALQVVGPQLRVDTLTVDENNAFLLPQLPHNGKQGILNFERVWVQATDEHRTVTPDPENSYRFIVDGDPVTEITIQYLHYLSEVDLNELIGQMILNGLVLNTP